MSLVTVSQHLWKKLAGPDEVWAHGFAGAFLVVSGDDAAVAAVETDLLAFTQRGEPDDRHSPDNFKVSPPVKVRVDGAREGYPSVASGTVVWPIVPAPSGLHRELLVAMSARHQGARIAFYRSMDQCHTVQVAERGELRQETGGVVDFTWARGPRGQLVHPSASAERQDGGLLVRISQSRHSTSGVKSEVLEE